MKWKSKKYNTVGTVRKSDSNIIERRKIDTSNTQMHDRSLFWFGLVHVLQYAVVNYFIESVPCVVNGKTYSCSLIAIL